MFIPIRLAFKAAGDIGLGDVFRFGKSALQCCVALRVNIYFICATFCPGQLRSIVAHPNLQLRLAHFAVSTQASRFSGFGFVQATDLKVIM